MIGWMLGLVLKATLLLVAVGVVARLARRAPAATRHFVWTSGLAVLLLLPALALMLPGWAPQWVSDWAPELLLAHGAAVSETPLVAESASAEGQRLELSVVTEGAEASRRVPESLPADLEAELPVTSEASGSAASGNRPAGMVIPWLLLGWIGGALLMASWLAVGLVRRARLARAAQALEDGALVDAGNEAAQALDLRRHVRLLLGEAPFVPMTWGVARPVLYLPSAAQGWSPRRLRTVLLHELAHIKRNDSLSRFLAQVACSLFWFHPLAWMAARRMLREQERACDDVVIVAGADPHEYAETLVQMAREFRSPRPCVVGALAFSRRSNLEQRLLSILDPLERRRNMSIIRKTVVAALFVAAVLPLAAFRPLAGAQKPGEAKPPVVPRVVLEPVEVTMPRLILEPFEVTMPRVVLEPVEVAEPRVVVEPLELAMPQLVVEPVEVAEPQVVAEPLELAMPRLVVEPVEAAPVLEVQEVEPEQVLEIIQEGGQIRLEGKGLIRFPADIDAVEFEPGGSLIVTEGDRRVEVAPSADGGLSFRYSVDGAEQPFDDDARAWVNGILSRSDIGVGDLQGNVLSLRIGDRGRVLRIYPGDLEMPALEPIELPELDLHIALEQLETALEPLEELSLTLEAPSHDLEITLGGLEAELEPLELTLGDLAPNLEPVKLSLSHIGTELESLELTLDGLRDLEIPDLAMPDIEISDLGLRRFDRIQIWRDDESRVAVMTLGDVEIGATVDDIDVGEDGHLVITERGPDGRHRLHVYTDDDGNRVYEWYVDGEETPFDDAARAWLGPILERLR